MSRRLFAAAAAALTIAGYFSGTVTARADQRPYTPAPTPSNGQLGYESGISGYFQNWFVRSDYARATQPHWMTPLVTVTPRLEQEVRYDRYWESLGNGADVDSYGSGKGLELIPTTTNEVLINVPAYLVRTEHKPASGWGDWPFLVVKQRLLSEMRNPATTLSPRSSACRRLSGRRRSATTPGSSPPRSPAARAGGLLTSSPHWRSRCPPPTAT